MLVWCWSDWWTMMQILVFLVKQFDQERSAGEASWEHQHTSNQTSKCSSCRVKTRCRIGIAAGCMFTLSRWSPAAPRVDPGGVIVSDAPHHTLTVRLHTEQMSRNLTPEPEPTAGTRTNTWRMPSTITITITNTHGPQDTRLNASDNSVACKADFMHDSVMKHQISSVWNLVSC